MKFAASRLVGDISFESSTFEPVWLSAGKHSLQILRVFGGLTGLPFGPSSPGGPLAPAGPAAPGGPASPFSPLSPLGPYSGGGGGGHWLHQLHRWQHFFKSLHWTGRDKNWRAVRVCWEKLDPKLISVCVTEDNSEWLALRAPRYDVAVPLQSWHKGTTQSKVFNV